MSRAHQRIMTIRSISFMGWRYIGSAFFAIMTLGSALDGQGLPATAFGLALALTLPFASRKITQLIRKRWNYEFGRTFKTVLVVSFFFFAMMQFEPEVKTTVANNTSSATNNETQTAQTAQTNNNITAGIVKTPTPTENQTTAPTSLPTPQPTQTALYKVVKVVDGDTLNVSMNGKTQRLRLIGMDTPETIDPRKPVQCYGKEASNKAKEILNGKSVRIETDPSQGELDKYDRLLAYVFLESGINYNLQMIQEGYAHEYTYDKPYKYQQQFKDAYKNAQQNKVGLWAENTCNGDTEKAAVATATKAAATPKPGVNATTPPAKTAVPQTNTGTSSGGSYSGGDKDCSDFSSHAEAQSFFISQGGPSSDPHRLDRDKDGLACEDLP